MRDSESGKIAGISKFRIPSQERSVRPIAHCLPHLYTSEALSHKYLWQFTLVVSSTFNFIHFTLNRIWRQFNSIHFTLNRILLCVLEYVSRIRLSNISHQVCREFVGAHVWLLNASAWPELSDSVAKFSVCAIPKITVILPRPLVGWGSIRLTRQFLRKGKDGLNPYHEITG